ncbi:MAG TPA: hypothetical protein VLJ16_12360 [Acidobacteriota bacterium]|nr:hypothetical protein [Acidobacteriota bacterium]
MIVRRTTLVAVVLVLAASAGLLMVAAAQVRPKPEKLCPITFHLEPTTLQAGYSRQIERTNAMLAQDLVGLRSDRAFMSGKVSRELVLRYENDYQKTYLAFPVLWDEQGVAHTGWAQVLACLATILPKATFIQPQAVNVFMEYIPLNERTQAFFESKLTATVAKRGGSLWFKAGDVDFLASIRTVLAYAPFDDPVVIGNEDPTPHQNVCDPIF